MESILMTTCLQHLIIVVDSYYSTDDEIDLFCSKFSKTTRYKYLLISSVTKK